MQRHSAKALVLPSATGLALGKASAFRLAHGKSSVNRHFAALCVLFCRERNGTRQSFAECPKKKTLGKDDFTVTFFAVCGLPSVALGKPFAEWKRGFAECLGHSAKRLCPVVSSASKSCLLD